MRILVVDHSASPLGGGQTYMRAVLAALAHRGHEVALLHELPRVTEGVPDPLFDSLPRWCVRSDGLRLAVDAALAWGPDVLHVNGVDPEVEDALAGARPSVLYAHNYYGTCATGRKCHTRPRVEACTRRLGPACLALNYALGCGATSPRTLLAMYRDQVARRDNLARYRAVMVASRAMEAEFLRHGVERGRLHLVPLFPATVTPDPEPPAPPRQREGRVLFAGRLTEIKGGALLVDALAIAARVLGRPLTLVVAGDGPERAPLEARARDCGVAAELLGWCDAPAMARELRRADLVAVPSLWPEPFGLIGIEAGGLGVPAVGFATGGIVDWLRPGLSGELAPADPPTAGGLADALLRALRDPDHHAALGRGAWEIARGYTLEAHLDRLEQILASVV
jgi:glycosyltransferase involved in cell wall biosynthesis